VGGAEGGGRSLIYGGNLLEVTDEKYKSPKSRLSTLDGDLNLRLPVSNHDCLLPDVLL
jgi:hypothetical protein